MKKIFYNEKHQVNIIRWLIQDKWVQIEMLNGDEKGMRRPARVKDEIVGKTKYQPELEGVGLDKVLKNLPSINESIL